MSTIFSWRQLRLAFAVVIAAVLALAGLAMPSQAETSEEPETPTTTIANIDPNAKGTLNIHKYVQPDTAWDEARDGTEIEIPVGATPLGGVQFTIYKVEGISLTTNEGWAAARQAVDNMPTEPAVGDAVATAITNAAGLAEFTNLDLGLYLVKETGSGDNQIISPAAPFLVAIPQPHEGGWLYEVNAYPKNAIAGQPTKTVDESETTALGDKVKWTIESDVPVLTDGDTYDSYVITDQLDSRLDYVGATVWLGTEELVASTDYTIDPADATSNGPLVTITLTADGLKKLDALTDPGKLKVEIVTNVNAAGDGTIYNEALVNVNGNEQKTLKPDTKWGTLQIIKLAADEKGKVTEERLAGAEFSLFADNNGEPAETALLTEITTDENGQIVVDPLKPGKYWLVETKAPAGYQLDATPREVNIVAGEITVEGNSYSVPNRQEPPFNLPLTGGTGTTLFTIAGLVLLVGAGAGYTIMRKRREA